MSGGVPPLRDGNRQHRDEREQCANDKEHDARDVVARDGSIENNLLNKQSLKRLCFPFVLTGKQNGRLDFAALSFSASICRRNKRRPAVRGAHWLKSLEGYENLKKRL
jgi:hypothetical protein